MVALPALKPKQVLRALRRAGFHIHHQTGSHVRLFHKTKSHLRVTIPIHSRDIPRTTLFRIVKQAELSKKEFLKYL
ncbi:MAG: type II toxin-antitoxin system HicA family toxin [Candidatus Nealsonbacteria bacterium]|nr:MAG: type II toxin-antitoxin system HicA family toxin [Candidatus Nealsonbacteria bacterium]